MDEIIEGVSIISVGEAKGHGLYIDEQTLREVKECAESYSGGVKVNLDHGAGIKDIVGFVNNFRIIEDQLLGDLNLLKTSPMREYVLEIADKLPDAFGISIAFSGPVREVDGKNFASCQELYSADLVQTPAANPTGLFSFEAVDKKSKEMESAEIEIEPKEDEVSIADLLKRVADLETAFGDYKKAMEKMPMTEEPKAEMCECKSRNEASELSAKLDLIIANFGAKPLPVSVAAEEKTTEKFDLKALITEKTEELGSRTAAIKFAMANHRNEYLAAMNSNQLNF